MKQNFHLDSRQKCDIERESVMSRPQEQITESSYEKTPDYWHDYATQIGGIEVCDDETGEPIFVLGQ